MIVRGNAALEESVRAVLEQAVEREEAAGASVLLLKEGRELCYAEAGLADRDTGRRIGRDTVFRLYSLTKPVTAAAVMILMERGELDLYTPVSEYLPGFRKQIAMERGRYAGEPEKETAVPLVRDVTVKDLLSMTSGLVYPGTPGRAGEETTKLFQELYDRLPGDHPMSTQETANRLGGCTLAFQPGRGWRYGTSADVLGAVVEIVSGKRFGVFLEEEIFQPLGMADTGFWLPQDKAHRLARVYEQTPGGLILYEGNHLGINHRLDRPPAYESGGAGLCSTMDDYARFARMLHNGGTLGGNTILHPATVRYLIGGGLNRVPQKAYDAWSALEGCSYGNLMRVMKRPELAGYPAGRGEYGWDGWLGAYFSNFPEEKLTFLVMMQRRDSGTIPLTRKLRNVALRDLIL